MRLAIGIGSACLLAVLTILSEARAESGEDRAGAYLALRLLGAVGSVRDIEESGITGAAKLEHRHDPVVGGSIAVGLSQPGALRA